MRFHRECAWLTFVSQSFCIFTGSLICWKCHDYDVLPIRQHQIRESKSRLWLHAALMGHTTGTDWLVREPPGLMQLQKVPSRTHSSATEGLFAQEQAMPGLRFRVS